MERYNIKQIIFVAISLSQVLYASASSISDEQPPLEISSRMQEIVKLHSLKILEWANSPLVMEFVTEQNKNDISLAEIERIDKEWVLGAVGLSKSLQDNALSKFLRKKVENSNLFVEAFVCDKREIVVGLLPRTTDYWQGDEVKFIKSFENGKGRIYFSPLAFDESTQTYSVHISVPIRNWNNTIGVLIVGVKNFQ